MKHKKKTLWIVLGVVAAVVTGVAIAIKKGLIKNPFKKA